MPSDERPTRRGADLTLTIGVLIAVFAALLPLMRVVRPSSWLIGAIVLAVAVLAAGYIARRYRLPALAVSLIEASVWVVVHDAGVPPRHGVPLDHPHPRDGPRAARADLGRERADRARRRSARRRTRPVAAHRRWHGLLTIIVDHVVLTARMPLLAAIGLIAVSLIPSIAVPGEVDIMAFVLLAAAILFLMRTDTRSREEPLAREATRTAGVPATALGIGAIAVVVALVAVPLLPEPVARAGAGSIGSRSGHRCDPAARRRPAPAARGRGAPRAQLGPVGAVPARHDAVAARRRRVGARPGAHGRARERARARRGAGRRGHPGDRVRHDRRGAQPRVAVASGPVSGRRRERTRGAVVGCALQPHGPRPIGVDPGSELRGHHERAAPDSRADPREFRGRNRPARGHDAASRRHLRRSSAISPPRSPPRRRTTTTRSSLFSVVPQHGVRATRSTPRSRRASTGRAPRRSRSSSRCARATASTSRRPSPSWPARSGCRAASWSATFPAAPRATRSNARRCTPSRAASCTPGPRCTSRASAGSRSSRPTASACRRPSPPPAPPRAASTTGTDPSPRPSASVSPGAG